MTDTADRGPTNAGEDDPGPTNAPRDRDPDRRTPATRAVDRAHEESAGEADPEPPAESEGGE